MIITDEKLLRRSCINANPEEVDSIINKLEIELNQSAIDGLPGIGLAAPQIGILKNIAIIRIDKNHSVNLVNCRIEYGYDKFIFESEGCLSFPNRYEKTLRYREIYVVENQVRPYAFVCTDLMAVAIQHELGHLSGELLPDVALPSLKEKNKKIRPNDPCLCGSGKKYKKCCKR